ncbi:hypothetical protein EJ05DRAFT_475733 [Pseudovirgaria hyperparasitica]|uniref:Uncharacterized protein n=1 Tax=Pseudovirgaria hyperparasitica TaxID=470096 RepID=A0A6A6WA09_9PEZI|nr:uncharacterized protein EJ05DRAFT_475733 [Pseudovirgaria hyperparasitica]KAF2758417.1 hypothetical protein EJ05DRAFT_475733 [Pseudovirgaria hyperparasitica]
MDLKLWLEKKAKLFASWERYVDLLIDNRAPETPDGEVTEDSSFGEDTPFDPMPEIRGSTTVSILKLGTIEHLMNRGYKLSSKSQNELIKQLLKQYKLDSATTCSLFEVARTAQDFQCRDLLLRLVPDKALPQESSGKKTKLQKKIEKRDSSYLMLTTRNLPSWLWRENKNEEIRDMRQTWNDSKKRFREEGEADLKALEANTRALKV